MKMRSFTDQMGRQVSVGYPLRRIISLVPSQSELLFNLGLNQEVVGITKFCVHPQDKFKSTFKIGGTKKLNMQRIRELNPDLIIGNKEENDQQQVEELMNEFPVWMSDISTLDDALEMIKNIGDLTGTGEKAELLAQRISLAFQSLNVSHGKTPKVAYFIWKDPYMIAGRHTFIDDILTRAGFDNFSNLGRYPVMEIAEIRRLKPEVILLSSEPYPFKDAHIDEMKEICPDAEVLVVDGEMFSWYGSHLLQTASYLQTLQKEII